MKISQAQFQTFLCQLPEGTKFFLIHGQDVSLMYERAYALASAFRRPLQVMHGQEIDSDCLFEAALNRSLLTDDPCLLVENAQDVLLPAIQTLSSCHLDAMHPIIMVAADAKLSIKIRAFCQKDPASASLACYKWSVAQLSSFIRGKLRGIEIQDAAMAYLVHYGSEYRNLLQQDLEKISVFKSDCNEPLTLEEAQGLCGREAEGGNFYALFDRLLRSVLCKRTADVLASLPTCRGSEQTLVSLLAYHLQRLLIVLLSVETGSSLKEALVLLSPSLHFSLAEPFQEAARLWSLAHVRLFVHKLFEADLRLREGKEAHLERLVLECVRL